MIILFDRKAVKENMMSRVFTLCMLVIQAILLLIVKGYHGDQIHIDFWDFLMQHRILLIYLAVVNILTIIVFGVDKMNAKSNRQRVRIVTLLGLAFIGGSVGCCIVLCDEYGNIFWGGVIMGRFVNPDNSAFQAALNSRIYVDKTGLIACMNNILDSTDAYICNSRPRRFGKSYAANMLAAYYSKGASSEEMFSKLDIGKTPDFKRHLNKYDVIHIDIQWFLTNCDDKDKVVGYITKIVLDELKDVYPDILPSEVLSLPDALSRVRNKTGRKFVIIIDEWDVLIRDEAANKKVQDDYIRFLRSMFKGIEPTKYIQLAYLTGILPIKKERTQSALNNFREYSMLNAGPLASYIGFTENEVKELCRVYNKDFTEVKRWYDGYQLGAYQVYNPNAVVNTMIDGNFQSYWSATASYDSIVPLINMDFDGLKTSIIEMLSGASVDVDVASFQNDISNIVNKDDVLTYLIHMGYLAYSADSKMAFVPNEEIRQELFRATRRKQWNELMVFQRESERLLDATLDMDGTSVAE